MSYPVATQFVYLLYAAGFVKVGRSNNVQSRIRQIQCGCPSRIDPIVALGKLPPSTAASLESELHFQMRKVRSHGEWFSCTAEQAIAMLAVYGVTFIGCKFFTFDNEYAELVKRCVDRERACRGWDSRDKSLQDAAVAEVKALLEQFPSPKEEVARILEKLPPVSIPPVRKLTPKIAAKEPALT
jgi:hypothetical protein